MGDVPTCFFGYSLLPLELLQVHLNIGDTGSLLVASPFLRVDVTVSACRTTISVTVSACITYPIHNFLWTTWASHYSLFRGMWVRDGFTINPLSVAST